MKNSAAYDFRIALIEGFDILSKSSTVRTEGTIPSTLSSSRQLLLLHLHLVAHILEEEMILPLSMCYSGLYRENFAHLRH